MPGTFAAGEKLYSLSDCIVAAYNITANTYSTPAALASGHTIEIEPESDNDELSGYGSSSALLSVVRRAKLTIGAGGFDRSIAEIVAGVTNTSSGSTIYRTLFPAGSSGLPYFGLIGVAAADDGAVVTVGLQCCKLDSFPKFTLDGKENKFNMTEITGVAIPIAVSSTSYLMHMKTYSGVSWTAPSTNTEFLNYFTTTA